MVGKTVVKTRLKIIGKQPEEIQALTRKGIALTKYNLFEQLVCLKQSNAKDSADD